MDQPVARTRFHERLRVRYADTDAQGHVFFANYLTYFDEALTGYFAAIGLPYKAFNDQGYDLVYRHAESEYLGRSFFSDQLEIDVTVERVGNTSITLGLTVYRGADLTVVARGAITCVVVDAKTLQKTQVPELLKTAIERFERGVTGP